MDLALSATLERALRQHEVEQFLFAEARLLDDRQFNNWLDLLTDDVHYWMPLRVTRARGEEDREFTRPFGEHSYFDDDKAGLVMRVKKLETGFSWSEDPPSRTRHFVANVRVQDGHNADEVIVDSAMLVYRSRLATDEDLWVGRREDVLRKVGGEWKIARRSIYLDQTVLKSKNLSIFF